MDAFKKLLPWMRLARLPNLLTVPGDPVAGFLLASAAQGQPPHSGRMAAAAGASLCLYVFGLILNDIVDIAEDARARPGRPLPSGDLTVPQARMAAIVMALSGLNLALFAGRAPLFVAAALCGAVIAYNAGLKRLPFAGVLCMGLCRGLSLLLGAAAACPDVLSSPARARLPVYAAAALSLYVAGFSAVARRETDPEPSRGNARWAPFMVLLPGLPSVLVAAHAGGRLDGLAPTAFVFLMVMVMMRAWLLGGIMYRCQPVPESVAGHIRNLLLLQACFCVAAGTRGITPALFFVALSFVFRRLNRSFYSS
ncbi:MAG: UbiA family prenyltransferase [Kiritimatiellae bacterium]|nr:UbiA family prenyltransferase [Kiritimatiellia bacterium]MDD3543880.1 UbiA family prenyltransferase [Kiritimatiellia bacterium]MDD4025359.1 UbiA family prenyltransferase [Kiritimatiellia bacterium]MDD4621813.1 UbiA family prenyltransferase [Kiritimatiellia bacterium]